MFQENSKKLNILRFQYNIYDLQNNHFHVLERKGFVEELLRYLKRLLELGYKETLLKVLQQLGVCAVTSQRYCLREKSLQIVTEFSHELRFKRDKDIFESVAGIIAQWLSHEREFQAGFYHITTQIRGLIKNMLSMQLWAQSEPLITASQNIIAKERIIDEKLRRTICLLHRQVVDQDIILCLVKDYSKGAHGSSARRLLAAFRPYSSEPMIQALVKAKKKELRLSLLDMLTEMKQGVLPVILEKLWSRQAWYVVRNCIILLGSLKDPDLYPFAKPFLYHPDSRVQHQVLHCIEELGGSRVVDRLISSYDIIKDDVKVNLIHTLSKYDNEEIGEFFSTILGSISKFAPEIRDQIIESIYESNQLDNSPKEIAMHNVLFC